MLTSLKSAVLSAAIAIGAIAAPTAAQAESGIYFHLGAGEEYNNDLGVEIQDSYVYRRHDRRDRRYREDVRRCSPERAAWKARRMGLERVRIVDVGRRTITVIGRDYGDRVRITFGRAPSCPVLGR